MVPRRKTAKQIAASRRNLIKARDKRKAAAPNKVVRKTYSGGLTYKTVSKKGLVMRHKTTHNTSAYKGAHLVGYGYSVSNRRNNSATIEDLYVNKSHRGTGVSRKILQHQAHATKGQKINVTSLRSEGGNKTAARMKIRGTGPVNVTKSNSDSAYVTGLTETAYQFQAAGHSGAYKREQKKLRKARTQRLIEQRKK